MCCFWAIFPTQVPKTTFLSTSSFLTLKNDSFLNQKWLILVILAQNNAPYQNDQDLAKIRPQNWPNSGPKMAQIPTKTTRSPGLGPPGPL